METEESFDIPLSEFRGEGAVKVVGLLGGGHYRNIIASMGIFPGMTIRVLRSNRRGPVLVSVFGETIMIGHGMARKIMVR